MNYIIRSFARRVQDAQKPVWKSKVSFEAILSNKEFLQSIGVKHYPINSSFNFPDPIDILDRNDKYIGSKSLTEAKQLAESESLDLILLETDPPLIKLDNFKQIILKEVRIAQSKTMRKNIKEDYRTISIRNTIKSHDLDLKLQRIRDFIKAYENVIIEIPGEVDSKISYDRAKILSRDIQLYLTEKFPDGECEIEKDDECIRVFFTPSQKRDEILEALSSNKELYKEAKMNFEFKKVKSKLNKYKYSFHPDVEEKKAAEENFLNTQNTESD